ncbi:DJ-1/PfpI family protein [Candidatus Absconditicoccus praedator]|uniref:DJ-1/PfpI family protein n=1 Tax=Candidatus Absconditicoccus praedator TaxID=2735562 RepID=UPI001E580D37|nr:DJ-1/PfpI family protein [Candidatus Absconditicoccus praedator]UFX83045.1 DJ-1/PfpI family protein [Candidatus Absconditicoccus praedator]
MKKILYVLGEGFRPEEYYYPKKIFEKNNFMVITTGKKHTIQASNIPGMPEEQSADVTFDEVNVGEYDAILMAGGNPAWKNLFNDESCKRLFIEASDKSMLIGGICAAPAVLANYGILEGKAATVFPGIGEFLEEGGANSVYDDESWKGYPIVQVDGNLITANGPWATESFAKAVIEKLG